jgi:hypothetical protein
MDECIMTSYALIYVYFVHESMMSLTLTALCCLSILGNNISSEGISSGDPN